MTPLPRARASAQRGRRTRTHNGHAYVCMCLFALALCTCHGVDASQASRASAHTSNWAVLVNTSKYWFNYRHAANTLSFYRTVKRLGIPDSNIILMMADDAACNPRNSSPGAVFNTLDHRLNIYGDDVEVDYRGYEVTVESFLRLLTGRHDPAVPRSKRLLSDANSNVLVYLSGHGGDGFIKFQDHQELLAHDIADAFQQMHEKGRYHELLFVAETCQAESLYMRINSPNVLACASSRRGQNSYAHHSDSALGLSVIDRFTYYTLEFFEHIGPSSNATLADLFRTYTYGKLLSDFRYRTDLYGRGLHTTRVTDFFGSASRAEVVPELYNFPW